MCSPLAQGKHGRKVVIGLVVVLGGIAGEVSELMGKDTREGDGEGLVGDGWGEECVRVGGAQGLADASAIGVSKGKEAGGAEVGPAEWRVPRGGEIQGDGTSAVDLENEQALVIEARGGGREESDLVVAIGFWQATGELGSE